MQKTFLCILLMTGTLSALAEVETSSTAEEAVIKKKT